MTKWQQFLPTKLFDDEIITDKVASVRVLILRKTFFIILLSWTVYIFTSSQPLFCKKYSYDRRLFLTIFFLSINNRLIMFTLFKQMDFPVDSTRSRCNKIRLNIFISFATYIDPCAGRGNVSKYVNDNIADFMWVAFHSNTSLPLRVDFC